MKWTPLFEESILTKHQICLANSQNFYEGLSRAFRDPDLTLIEADLSHIHYLFPWQLTLAACLKVWCQGKAALNFHWNESKNYQLEIASYAEKMGLFEGLDSSLSPSSLLQKPGFNADNYFELHAIDRDNGTELLSQLQLLLSRFPDSADPIAPLLFDLSQNIVHHSGAQEGSGWGYVQAQTTAAKLRIAFCDFGVGYYKTYQRQNLLNGRSPKEILETSLESGPGDKASVCSQKHGLSKICEFLKSHKGWMEIYSDGLKCRYVSGKKSTTVLGYRTKGSLVILEIPLKKASASSEMF